MLKKIKVLCMATLMVITPTLTMAISGEVRKITPPKLDTAYLGQKNTLLSSNETWFS